MSLAWEALAFGARLLLASQPGRHVLTMSDWLALVRQLVSWAHYNTYNTFTLESMLVGKKPK